MTRLAIKNEWSWPRTGLGQVKGDKTRGKDRYRDKDRGVCAMIRLVMGCERGCTRTGLR